MRISTKRLLAFMIVVVMIFPIITATVASAAVESKFTFNVGEDMEIVKQGTRFSGESERFGTNDYFTLHYASKTYVDENSKTFSDGKSFSKRVNMQSAGNVGDGVIEGVIGFNTTGPATIKVWYVSGEAGRYMTIFDRTGYACNYDNTDVEKNELHIANLTVTSAGEYYLGSVSGGNYIYCVEVIESNYNKNLYSNANWDSIAAPSITSVADDGNGNILVSVEAQVGIEGVKRYAEELVVTVTGGNVCETYVRRSSTNGSYHNFVIPVDSSGNYEISAAIKREGSADKISATANTSFILPLETPTIMSATSAGGGTIDIEYTAVPEAEKYEIYFSDGTYIGETTKTIYTVSDLTIGDEHSFYIIAVRGEERTKSENSANTLVTEYAQIAWGFTYYGPSTSASKNGYTGDLNKDGKVTVYAKNNGGKIQPKSADGIAFYYTKIPTSKNFTLRATVTVDTWTYSNGQEGFGLLVTDRLGTHGDTSNILNNQYMAGCTKVEYWYAVDEEGVESIYNSSVDGKKISMRLGLGAMTKRGFTLDNLESASQDELFYSTDTLEKSASIEQAGSYNLVGSYTNKNLGHSDVRETKTQFILEIQRANTGYFIRYYDEDGNLLGVCKDYAPDALDQLDSDYVYAGFFAARNAVITVSDVSLTTVNKEDDTFEEPIEITKVIPLLNITSASSSTSDKYTFEINTNLSGVIEVIDGLTSEVVAESRIDAKGRIQLEVDLDIIGENPFYIRFNPDDDQYIGEHMEIAHNGNVVEEKIITRSQGSYHRKSIYVSPTGDIYGDGTKENPLDLETAIKRVIPGQTIILMEGTYKFDLYDGQTLKIERGINGTEEDPIRLIADPDAETRPVIDFGGVGNGIVHGGNWWIFEGFDVTRSANGQKGFQVSGSYNVLVDIHAYRNGNSGIQLSRYAGSDYKIADWPSYNLILNCDSYYNMDSGHEDADGFAAKLTCGPGNVFDGCVAYNNADDGWDLYAKIDTGNIGAVTIQNCVAYNNGYLEDGSLSKGNGNGFKMGGESLSGHHVIRNSYAINNKAKGIDSNSCPDIEAYNCISFNNGNYNFAFYTNDAHTTAFKASGVISIRTENLDIGENFKPKNQKGSDYNNETTFYWTALGCINYNGDVLIPENVFVSLEFKGVERNADGTINLGDFLKIKDGAVPEGVGPTGESTPSPELSLVPDIECVYSESWIWDNKLDPYHHWHECECGNKKDVGDHTFEYVIDKEPTETQPGYKHNECTVCGYKKATIEIPPLGNGNDDVPTEEPTGFAAIWQAIVEFFESIVAWFKDLFGGAKK